MGDILDFNKAVLAQAIARYKSGERDPGWEDNPALTAAVKDFPEYVHQADWMTTTFHSMPENIQKITAMIASTETAHVPESERQDAFMTVLLRLLREWAHLHEAPDCP